MMIIQDVMNQNLQAKPNFSKVVIYVKQYISSLSIKTNSVGFSRYLIYNNIIIINWPPGIFIYRSCVVVGIT